METITQAPLSVSAVIRVPDATAGWVDHTAAWSPTLGWACSCDAAGTCRHLAALCDTISS